MHAEAGKRYRHYKNQKTYRVLTVAFESESLREQVVYQAEYDDPELGAQPVFVRSRGEFEEVVHHNGTQTNRFVLVE